MAQLRLVMADDNPQFLRTLVSLLEVEFEIVATAANSPSALALVRHSKPDVIVLGINLRASDSLEVIRELAKQPQGPPVVICSAETDPGIVETALRAGATGYVSQARIEQDLILAVQSAHQRRSFVSGGSAGDEGGGTADHAQFFKELGRRIRELREKAGYSQGDMTSFGFSTRHWQQIEAGRPITTTTLLRICRVFKIKSDDLLRGLSK